VRDMLQEGGGRGGGVGRKRGEIGSELRRREGVGGGEERLESD
jgi:hypothetical protein